MMRRAAGFGLLLWSLGLSAVLYAQEAAPPKGPADIMKRAAQARQRSGFLPSDSPAEPPRDKAAGARKGQAVAEPAQPQQAGELPPGHPQLPAADVGELPPGHPPPRGADGSEAATGAGGSPVGNDPHAHAQGAPPLSRRPLTEGEPSSDVPAGSVRVRVLDGNERPVADADLQLGSMSQDSGRTSTPAKTGADGRFTFSELATGDKQAYRVNVLYQGAKYSSMPFRLPADRGYDVVIRRLETTKDARELVLYVGATSVELKDERLRIVQQARLVNIGAKTYVFPDEGTLVRLPKDAMAFQAEEIMTDQHLREVSGEGMRITGSIPPGEVTLTWGFDIPQTDSTAELTFELPWITFAYRVLADAAPGMTLEVDDMPAPELHEDRGRRLLVTEVVKRVGDAPLDRIHIKLTGIPGPGPLRFIAVAIALGVLALGLVVSRTGVAAGGSHAAVMQELQLEQDRLLARAKELDQEQARGEIGPEFHKQALSELEEQLSGVLYERQRVAHKGKPGQSSRSPS